MKRTMLKKEDWGGLTILSLLAVFAFPPYFIHLMTMAALSEFAHLWTTHLDTVAQGKFVEFEKKFRKGYQMEKSGDKAGALAWYRALEKEYSDLPQAEKLATLQIRKLHGKDAGAASHGPKNAFSSSDGKSRRPKKRKG